jgi:phosphoribosyl 1,2-cyclic phosphodiesterase
MENRIIFLGTAGDALTLNKLQRTAAGIIIQDNQTQIHINPGPAAVYKATASGVDPRQTNIVIVTDNTLLHAHDTNALIDIMTAGCFDQAGILLAAKSAVKQAEEHQPLIHKKYQDAVDRLIIMEEENKVEINNIQIQAMKIKNSDPHAIGIKVITDAYSLAYTGKAKYTVALRDACKGVEILVLDLSHVHETKKENGLSIEEAKKLITTVQPKVAILTGFGFQIRDILDLTRQFNKETKVQTIATTDGYTFDPTSYAVKLRQKRLMF